VGEEGWIDGIKDIRLDLLEIMGAGYLIDVVKTRAESKFEELAYRVYVTDVLSAAIKSLTGNCPERYYDVIHPDRTPQITAEEAKNNIKNKLSGGGINGTI
jgi:hypothetical protein